MRILISHRYRLWIRRLVKVREESTNVAKTSWDTILFILLQSCRKAEAFFHGGGIGSAHHVVTQ
jgi:hypothetical protein